MIAPLYDKLMVTLAGHMVPGLMLLFCGCFWTWRISQIRKNQVEINPEMVPRVLLGLQSNAKCPFEAYLAVSE